MRSARNEYDRGRPATALTLTQPTCNSELRALSSSASRTLYALADMAKYFLALGRYDQRGLYAKEAIELAHRLRFVVVATRKSYCSKSRASLLLKPTGRRADYPRRTMRALLGFSASSTVTSPRSDPRGVRPTAECDRALAVLREVQSVQMSSCV